MRREFIIVLLGIIFVSTITSMLSGYVQIEADKVLLDTVVGVVSAGNFSYWQLAHTGPIIVELTSLSGDADLYVSDIVRPTYEVDMNNFSSVTCGPDLISISPDFPRPIGVGVFGHWSHSLSEYSLQVYLDATAVMDASLLLVARQNQERSELDRRTKEKSLTRKTEEENKPRFLKLLSILDMVFEMFVL